MSKQWTPAQIRKLRESLKLTQEEFAAKCNVALSTAQSWEQPPTSVRHRTPGRPSIKWFEVFEQEVAKTKRDAD